VKAGVEFDSDKMSEQGAPPNRRPSGSSTIQLFANAYEDFFSIGAGR
jgi:hypothetical protein